MHAAQPRMLTIAQPTEYGTVYTIDELKQLSALAKKYNLYFRMFLKENQLNIFPFLFNFKILMVQDYLMPLHH